MPDSGVGLDFPSTGDPGHLGRSPDSRHLGSSPIAPRSGNLPFVARRAGSAHLLTTARHVSEVPGSAIVEDPVFARHRGGKMAVTSTVPLTSREDLALAYTPGVAQVCEAIAADPALTRD